MLSHHLYNLQSRYPGLPLQKPFSLFLRKAVPIFSYVYTCPFLFLFRFLFYFCPLPDKRIFSRQCIRNDHTTVRRRCSKNIRTMIIIQGSWKINIANCLVCTVTHYLFRRICISISYNSILIYYFNHFPAYRGTLSSGHFPKRTLPLAFPVPRSHLYP